MAKKTKSKKTKTTDTDLPVRATLKHLFPPGHKTMASNHMVVHASENEVNLFFFQIRSPILLGEEDVKRLKNLQEVDAECVSEIMMSPQRFLEFRTAINVQADKLLAATAQPKQKKQGKSNGKKEMP